MRSLKITICSRFLPVRRVGKSPLRSVLEDAGHHVVQVEDGALDLTGTDVLWIAGNANWYPRVCRQLIGPPKPPRPLVVVWHSEPLPPPRAAGLPRPRLNLREIAKILLRDRRATDVYSNYFRLRSLARQELPDVLAVSTLGRREFLAEHGIHAHWVPLGYHASQGHDMRLHRDIDTLFLGTLDVPRRQRLLRRLRRSGLDVVTAGNWFDPTMWGDSRRRLLNRTKVLLNLGRHPGELSGQRLILGMANKALVVSEPIYKPAPYVPGTHYVSAALDEIPHLIGYYLTHDDERARIVNEGHRLVTEEVTTKRSVWRILALMGAPAEDAADAPREQAGAARP
jgi:hypothetical protein